MTFLIIMIIILVYELKRQRELEKEKSLLEANGGVTAEIEHVTHRAFKPKHFQSVTEAVEKQPGDTAASSLESLLSGHGSNNSNKKVNKLSVLLKADGPDTLKALEKIITQLISTCNQQDVQVSVVHSSIGDVVQSDIERLSTIKGAETCVLGEYNLHSLTSILMYTLLFMYAYLYITM